jgi:hypothetical protein
VTFAFASSNNSVATVDANGHVKAVGVGSAVITVSCGDVSVSCAVSVVDETTKLYAFNASGWEMSGLMKPGKVTDSASLSTETGLSIAQAVYNTEDGYVYAIDEDGYVWQMTVDLSDVRKISTNSLMDAVAEEYDGNYMFVYLAFNTFNGKLYAMVSDAYGYSYYIAAVTVDENGVLTVEKAGEVADNVIRPTGFAFDSATTYLVYDSTYDFLYRSKLGADMWTSAQSVLWVQQSVAAGDTLALYYSKSLNRLLMVTNDDWYHSGQNALYIIDLNAGTITECGDGAWKSGLNSIFMIEGASPATSLPASVEETEVPETEEVVETVVETETAAETEEVAETETTAETETETVIETETVTETVVETETAE